MTFPPRAYRNSNALRNRVDHLHWDDSLRRRQFGVSHSDSVVTVVRYDRVHQPRILNKLTDILKQQCWLNSNTMMLPTHALVGVALALPVAVVSPQFAGTALLAGLLGGVLPDFDMYVGHRKTLHYPIYYSVLATVAVPVAVLVPTTVTVGLALVLLGAAVHSVMDIFGGGLELRPWEATSDRAVFDHHRNRWLAPRRWIRYDGASEDLLLSLVVGIPLLMALEGVYRWVVVATLVVAIVYTAVRRVLPTIAEFLIGTYLVRTLPDRVLAYLPARYVPDSSVR